MAAADRPQEMRASLTQINVVPARAPKTQARRPALQPWLGAVGESPPRPRPD